MTNHKPTEKHDPLMKIIEAGYHCAWHMAEYHAAIKEAGLDEVSDETIHNLLGKYADQMAELANDHWCAKHKCRTGEGDICGQCEAEFDDYRMLVNLEMSKHQYQLWFVVNGKQFRCPVADFDEAKVLHCVLRGVTGVRIARMDPFEGCESVLHKFS